MKKTLRVLLTAIAIISGLSRAEAQPLPIKVGYTALAGSFTPLWIAKELDLFERQGIRCSPIYMASTLAYQAMLAGETRSYSLPILMGLPFPLWPARRFSNQATCVVSALE